MHDSMTMAEVGSIVKVSGKRIATPLGPPSPGSTPTKTPSTRPTIISAMVFHVSRTAKPCMSRPRASMAIFLAAQFLATQSLATQGRFERALRHDHVKRYIEDDEHDGGEQER